MSGKTFNCGDDMELFFRKLPVQYGGAATMDRPMFFAGVRRQRGAGIGGIFGTLARRLLPFAKKYILPHALEAVKNVASDLSEGKNFKQSLKQNGIGALKSAGNQILNQSGSGFRRKKTKSKSTGRVGKKGKKSRVRKQKKKAKKPKRSKTNRRRKEKSPLRSIFH